MEAPVDRCPRASFALLGIVIVVVVAAGWPCTPAAAQAIDSLATPVTTASSLTLPPPRLGGYLQVRNVASDRASLTTFLNRARLSADGALPSKFSYRALVECQASAGRNAPATVSLREAIVRWNPAPFSIMAGEFKTPFTREYLIPVPELEVADLATAVDSIAPKYDVGLMATYTLGALASASLGVFNGEGANAIANRDSTVLWVARVTVRPIPQLGLGASGTRDGKDSLRWGVDVSAEYLGAVVRAEYMTRHRRGRDRNRDDFGWTVLETARVLPYLQLVARQEDFQRPIFGAVRRVRGLAYGTNIDVAPNRVRLLLEFSRRITGARQLRCDSFIGQVQARF